MGKIRLTAKRQATFPARLCDEMGLSPGDEIELKRTKRKGKAVWVMEVPDRRSTLWIGSLKRFASNAQGDHAMDSIRESIARGRGSEARKSSGEER